MSQGIPIIDALRESANQRIQMNVSRGVISPQRGKILFNAYIRNEMQVAANFQQQVGGQPFVDPNICHEYIKTVLNELLVQINNTMGPDVTGQMGQGNMGYQLNNPTSGYSVANIRAPQINLNQTQTTGDDSIIPGPWNNITTQRNEPSQPTVTPTPIILQNTPTQQVEEPTEMVISKDVSYCSDETVDHDIHTVPNKSVIKSAKVVRCTGNKYVDVALFDLPPVASDMEAIELARNTYKQTGLPTAGAYIHQIVTSVYRLVKGKPSEVAAHFKAAIAKINESVNENVSDRLSLISDLLDTQTRAQAEVIDDIIAGLFNMWFRGGFLASDNKTPIGDVSWRTETIKDVLDMYDVHSTDPDIVKLHSNQQVRAALETLGETCLVDFSSIKVYDPKTSNGMAHTLTAHRSFGVSNDTTQISDMLVVLIDAIKKGEAAQDKPSGIVAAQAKLATLSGTLGNTTIISIPRVIWVSNIIPTACIQRMGVPYHINNSFVALKNPSNELEHRLLSSIPICPKTVYCIAGDHTTIKLQSLVAINGSLIFRVY
jgi:hypothetical protein